MEVSKSKKILVPKTYCIKKFWSAKIFFGPQKIVRPKILWGKKFCVPKKSWVQKMLGEKFRPEKFLGLKNFLVQKNFGSKKIIGPKRFFC